MNEHQGVWWDIIKTISNVIAMILAVGFGWLTRRFSSIEKRMNVTDDRMTLMEKDFSERNQQAATSIAVLQSYHTSNLKRLDSIDDQTKAINTKLDQLILSMTKRRE